MRRLLTCILSCLTLILNAQLRHVEGEVRDSASREGLAGAVVFAGFEHATLTNENGFFSFDIPENTDSLSVSFLGYDTKKVAITGKHVIVFLTAQSRFLEPVVVSAGKQNQREIETTVSMATLQPYLIQNRITSNIENTIQQIPGITSTDGQANIRSGSGWSYGTGSRVSVLVDDMPMLAGGTGQAHWSFFPIENVRQVEVIKGSSSVLYGSSALNGVIHIRTDWPGNKEKISASAYSGFYGAPPKGIQAFQTDRLLTKSGGHFLYGKGSERMQYIFSVNGMLDEGYRMGEQNKRLRLSGKTRFFSKDKKWIYGLNGNVLAGKTGSFLLWENYQYAYTSLDSSYGLNDSRRYNLDPYLEFHGNKTEHYLQTRWYSVVNMLEQVDGEPDQSNRTSSVYSEYRVKWKQFQKLGLTLNTGGVASYSESNASMFQGLKVQQNFAAYLQADYSKNRWNISAGARYEYFRLETYKEGKPVLKAGINYRAAKATYLRASFGQGYRFPVVSEAFIRTSAGPVTIYPNETLRSESGYSMEVGLRQGFQSKGGLKFMADLAFFRMYYENMMEFTFAQWGTWTDPLGGLGFKSVNIGPSLIQGVELSLTGGGKWKKNDFRFMAGYTYADPQNREPDLAYANVQGIPYSYKSTSTDTSGKILKYRNRHLIKTDVQWENTRWGMGLSYRYASAFEAMDRAFFVLIAGVEESVAANKRGDHVVDLRVFYLINSDWKITFTMNNLFNEEILSRPADIGPPRNFNCQLSFRY